MYHFGSPAGCPRFAGNMTRSRSGRAARVSRMAHWMQQPQRICYRVFDQVEPTRSPWPRLFRPSTPSMPEDVDSRVKLRTSGMRVIVKGLHRRMRAMMKIRNAVVALAIGMSPALAAPIPVALVEEVSGAPAGVEFMDYVETGKTIELGARGGIVLSYLNSCVRETISSGTVTVGTDQSDVQGGKVARTKVPCDPGNLALMGDKSGQFAGRVFRSGTEGTSAVEAQLTLYGRSPLLELKGPGTLLIERLDQTSERYLVDVGTDQLLHGRFYDFGKWGRHLAAGGIYRISRDTQDGQEELLFKSDAHAKPGNTPMAGRLLRLNSAK
jgi:hypothetical protein